MADVIDLPNPSQSRRNFLALRLLKAFMMIGDEARQAVVVELVEGLAAGTEVAKREDGVDGSAGDMPTPPVER